MPTPMQYTDNPNNHDTENYRSQMGSTSYRVPENEYQALMETMPHEEPYEPQDGDNYDKADRSCDRVSYHEGDSELNTHGRRGLQEERRPDTHSRQGPRGEHDLHIHDRQGPYEQCDPLSHGRQCHQEKNREDKDSLK